MLSTDWTSKLFPLILSIFIFLLHLVELLHKIKTVVLEQVFQDRRLAFLVRSRHGIGGGWKVGQVWQEGERLCQIAKCRFVRGAAGICGGGIDFSGHDALQVGKGTALRRPSCWWWWTPHVWRCPWIRASGWVQTLRAEQVSCHHFLLLFLQLLRVRLLNQRLVHVNLPSQNELLEPRGPALVQHRPDVDVKGRALAVGHLADVTLVQFGLLILLLLAADVAQEGFKCWALRQWWTLFRSCHLILPHLLLLHDLLQLVQVADAVVVHEEDVLLGERLLADVALERPVGVHVLFQGVVEGRRRVVLPSGDVCELIDVTLEWKTSVFLFDVVHVDVFVVVVVVIVIIVWLLVLSLHRRIWKLF